MKHINLSMAAAALLLLAAGGCKTQKDGFIQPSKPNLIHNVADDINEVNKILYGEWIVIAVNGQNVTGDNRPYLGFEAVPTNPFLAKFYGSNGCNIINGEVAVNPKGSMKKASDYISTMKYCPDAEYELGFTMVMDNIAGYKIEKIGEEYLLYLNAENAKQNMVLRRSDIGFVNGAWRIARVGDVVIDEDAGAEIVIDVPEKKIHGNTGCNIMNGEITIDPDVQHSLRFGNLITTRMACDNPEREQSILSALNNVVLAQRDGDNRVILRDAAGKNIMELQRIALTHEVNNEVD